MNLNILQAHINRFIPDCEQEASDKRTVQMLIDTFPDTILTRKNPIAHLTGSGFIVNKNRSQCLMVYHNIYNSWSWTGGHADGDADLFSVAIREAREETGISGLRPLTDEIAALDVLPVIAHFRKGQYVSAHLHLSIAYLFEGDETLPLVHKPDENKAVAWIDIHHLEAYCTEAHMLPIYRKLITKAQGLA